MHTERGHGDRENGANNSRKEVTMAMTNNVLVTTISSRREHATTSRNRSVVIPEGIQKANNDRNLSQRTNLTACCLHH